MALGSAIPATPASRGVAQQPIRVVIIDDSAVIRGLTKKWLAEESDIEVVTAYSNGAHAVASIAKDQADIAILDIEMPQMDGLTALPKLLEQSPGLTVLIASTLSKRNADISLKAMALGAADYLPKPDTNQRVVGTDTYQKELVEKIRALGRSRPRRRATLQPAVTPAYTPRRPIHDGAKVKLRTGPVTPPRVLLIGSSTGGPQALTTVFEMFKGKQIKVPVFVTQHMPPMFTSVLAEQLHKVSGLPCREAIDGELAKSGHVYVAPGDYHMVLKADGPSTRISLNQEPQVNFCRPAVDPLLFSAEKIYHGAALAVILTGMGHDGRDGCAKLAEAGAQVYAQDETTSVVWGMPGAVAEAGLANQVLSISRIAPEVLRLVGGGR